jgi:hypothetical protein
VSEEQKLEVADMPKLSAEELLLLQRNADQFRHYINKKSKRLKLQAKPQGSITSEE